MAVTHRAPVNDLLPATAYLVKGAFAELQKDPERLRELLDEHGGEEGLITHLCWFAELAVPWHGCSVYADLNLLHGYTDDSWFQFVQDELGGSAGRWLTNRDELPVYPQNVYAARLANLQAEARGVREEEDARDEKRRSVRK